MSRRVSLAAVLLGPLLFAAIAGPARGQQPDGFEVLIPGEGLTTVTGSGVTIGEGVGSITASADDEVCASADVSTATEGVLLQLGLPGQPDACSREGAFVTFQDGRGFWFTTSMTLRLGTRATFDNFAPVPPGAPKPSPTFYVVISGEHLADRLADGSTLGASLGTITALVAGQDCLTANVASATNDQVLALGPEQADACSLEGAIVTFRTAAGHRLNAWYTWQRGERVTLSNFAPTPPCSPGPCPTPGPSPTPGPAPASTVSISPPDTGSGGLLISER